MCNLIAGVQQIGHIALHRVGLRQRGSCVSGAVTVLYTLNPQPLGSALYSEHPLIRSVPAHLALTLASSFPLKWQRQLILNTCHMS